MSKCKTKAIQTDSGRLPLFIMGNWELVKSIMGTKFQRRYVCLRSQVGNSVPITGSVTASVYLFGIFINFDIFSKLQWNGSALLCYALLISIQKLTQVIKSNITDTLRIERDSRKIGRLAIVNTSKRYWVKDGIGQKGFPDNAEDLRNAIDTYSQILQMEKNRENILK